MKCLNKSSDINPKMSQKFATESPEVPGEYILIGTCGLKSNISKQPTNIYEQYIKKIEYIQTEQDLTVELITTNLNNISCIVKL